MQISWLGGATIRLQSNDTVVLIDPTTTRQAADIVAITQKEGRDWSSIQGDPMIIQTPGEFERKNVFVYGLPIASEVGRVHFRIEGEDISLGHLADLNHKLENGELEKLEGVDVLFVPIGGHGVTDAETASTIISQIEPRMVIPIQYKADGMKSPFDGPETFIKEMGAKNVETLPKIRIAKKDLPAEETKVVLLTPA